MKGIKYLIFVAMSVTGLVAKGDIHGIWRGKIQGVLPIVVNVVNDTTVTLSSPAQGAMGIPCSGVKIENQKELTFGIPQLGVSYTGIYDDATDKINGTFVQGQSLTLNLERGDSTDLEVKKPQTPQPPFPYVTEEVNFNNGDVTLSGTLTIPSSVPENGKFPAVVMVSGSGSQDRDESILGHKPFAVIADYLTRKGIAVLRYDDRGAGKSSRLKGDETTYDYASDALAGVRYLAGRNEIDKVGIIGHSEGGTVAMINAAENPDEIAFIVSLAGMAVNGADLMVKQNMAISELYGKRMNFGEIALISEMFGTIAKSDDRDKLKDQLRPLIKGLHPEYDDAQMEKELSTVTIPWYVEFVKLTPGKYLKEIKCPMLALNGTWDAQVDCEMNLKAIASNVPAAKIVAFPELNHLFQEAPDRGSSMQYGSIQETISPDVLKTMANWILEVTE